MPSVCPPDVVNADAGGQGPVSVDEVNALVVKGADEVDYVLDLKRLPECLMQHVPARRVGHLAILEMEPRPREITHGAAVIVVEVTDDDVLHRAAVDVEKPQSFGG